MIIAPLTGSLGISVNTEFFLLSEIPLFEHTALFQSRVSQGLGLTFEEFEQPIDFIHKQMPGQWLIWMLIFRHAGAALYHHFVKKDCALLKMTTGQDQPQ